MFLRGGQAYQKITKQQYDIKYSVNVFSTSMKLQNKNNYQKNLLF